MTKIVITNHAEPDWKPVIEAKLQIMLGSMLAYASRIDIRFDRIIHKHSKRATYTCKLILVEDNGERYAVHSDQPNGEMAIEGAIARTRRAT